ncbi:putative Sulfatase-modifying factor enzyme domain-containing protein [Candidatus Magnetomoraceae bacterium gMMP-15]
MGIIISTEHIDEIISKLNYNKNSVKYKLIHFIRKTYNNKNISEYPESIDSDQLIEKIWNINNDSNSVKMKRKNFNSVKTSVNGDLKRLYKKGDNSEGIIIGPKSTFDISDEARANFFSKFISPPSGDTKISLEQLYQLIDTVSKNLLNQSKIEDSENDSKLIDLNSAIKNLSNALEKKKNEITEKLQASGADSDIENKDLEDEKPEAEKEPDQAQNLEIQSIEEELDIIDEDDLPDEIQEDDPEEIDDKEDYEIKEQDLQEEILIDDDTEPEAQEEDDEAEIVEDDESLEVVDEDEFNFVDQEFSEEFIEINATENYETRDEATDSDDSFEILDNDKFDFVGQELLKELAEDNEEADESKKFIEALIDEGARELDMYEDDNEIEIIEDDESLEVVDEDEFDFANQELSEEFIEAKEGDQEELTNNELIDEGQYSLEVIDEDGLSDDSVLSDAVEIPDKDNLVEKFIEQELEIIDEDDLPDDLVLLDADEVSDDAEEISENKNLVEKFIEQKLEIIDEDDVKNEVSGNESTYAEELVETTIGKELEEVDDLEIIDEDDLPDETENEDEGWQDAVEEDEEDDDLEDYELTEAIIGKELEEVDDDLEIIDEENLPDIIENEDEGWQDAVEENKDEYELTEETIGKELEDADEQTESDDIKKSESTQIGLESGDSESGGTGNYDIDILIEDKLDGYIGSMEKFYNQYRRIPANTYIVGAKKPGQNERSVKRQFMSEFYIGKFPVINLFFETFVQKTGYVTTAEKQGYGMVYSGHFKKNTDPNTGRSSITFNSAVSYQKVYGACWYHPLGPDSNLNDKRHHPVVQVSFGDACAFAAWVGKRLPAENEWEAASRTEKGYIYPWSNKWKKYYCNVEESAAADTTPVDKYQEYENKLGIADTLGNVLEWTMDLFESYRETDFYIVKGASWVSDNDATLFRRTKLPSDYTSNILGFRCLAE